MRKQLTVFQRALVNSVLEEYGDILNEQDAPAEFSNKLENWLNGLQEKPKSRAVTVLKGILIAAIIAALLAGAAMAIPAVREAVINFLFYEDDVQIGITFDPEQAATAPDQIETSYTLYYVPDTFLIIKEEMESYYTNIWWMNDSNQWISFMQYPTHNNTTCEEWWTIDAEETQRTSMIIGDYLVHRINGEEYYKLIWTNNEYLFMLELPYSVSEEEMQKIFASWGSKE